MKAALHLLSQWAKQRSEVIALKTPNKNYSWNQLNHRVNQLSQSLMDQQLQSGDVLACVSKNSVDFVLIYLACVRLGVIPALIAPQPYVQLEKKLTQLNCHHIWLGEGSAEYCDYETAEKLDRLNRIVLSVPDSVHALNNVDLNVSQPIVSLVFTSGSTGNPKAVAHSIENHLKSAEGLLKEFHYQCDDLWLLSLPMFHVSGLAIIWRWLSIGGGLKIGKGESLATDLQGVTHASLVPTQLKRLLDSGMELSLSHVLLGGSDIPVELALQAKAQGIETWLGYGMTEAASTVTAKPVDGKQGVGKVLANRKVKVENKLIYIGGETLAMGYFNRGVLDPIAQYGWFDSKDLGVWDAEQLLILGRADNQFISGGENIHCEEIESILCQSPDVLAVFVVPVCDKEFGSRPVALIACPEELNIAQYKSLVSSQLEKFKWPIEYLKLPKSLLSASGIKISRYDVKKWFKESQHKYQLVI